MKTTEQVAAEILVECGYAYMISGGHNHPIYGPKYFVERGHTALRPMPIEVNPFADTLEGRKQADAIIDFLRSENLIVDYLRECADENNELNEFDSRRHTIKWWLEQQTD